MRTEQQALKTSLVGVLLLSALGIGFGIASGSYAIIFDGVFSLIDAVMSIVSITLAGLIARSASNTLSRRTRERFNMGFWHFEPMLLAVNALLMISVASYALFQAITALLSGGREVEFGPAIVYTVVVVVLTSAIGIVEHRANRRIGSALVAMDVKGWLMGGGITAALLIAFVIGMFLSGTGYEWLMPYVDPAVLTIVALVLLPVPFSTLRKSLGEIALVTPKELKDHADRIAERTVTEQGWNDARVYAAQVGRSRTVDIVFYVPEDEPARPLAEWDRIRDGVRHELDGGDPHSWINVLFTTKPVPHKVR
ncbi:cation transporter [Kocuria coralli]|uniref:Cation transporter n=1 Tax=Kocuria coralli TaxID=1461025 RepID=A0A5J5L331_9MICC|nr:cation transporter [Kocuria coralli]KAA9395496.1 cation transporter [Kocuria coralli]